MSDQSPNESSRKSLRRRAARSRLFSIAAPIAIVFAIVAVLGLCCSVEPALALEPTSFRWTLWQTRLDGTLRSTPSSVQWQDSSVHQFPEDSRWTWGWRTRASVHRIEDSVTGLDPFWPEEDGLRAGGRRAIAEEPRAAWRLSKRWYLQGAALWSVADETETLMRLQTLALIHDGERHRLSFGREPLRWGPGLQGSLLLGRSAPTRWQASWQTNRALRFPFKSTTWSGAAFFAYLDDEDRRFPNPLLMGHRLSWQPVEWFELTGTRTILFGGEGRTRRLNLGHLWDILTVQNENTVGERPVSDSDQRASFEGRIQLPLSNWAKTELYYEYGGEDVNDPPLPSAVAHQYGAVTKAWGHTAAVEFVETVTGRNRWYSHTLYRTGYFHQGYPLGLALGGDAESWAVTLWSPPGDASWRVAHRQETFGFESDTKEHRVTWELAGRLAMGEWWAEALLSRTRRIGSAVESRSPAYARDRLEIRFERRIGPWIE